jgi:hypothetical protein
MTIDTRPRDDLVDPGPDLVKPVNMLYTFWDTGDKRFLEHAVDPSFVDNTLPTGRPQGPGGPVAASAGFRRAVPDLTCELSDLLVVAASSRYRLVPVLAVSRGSRRS